MSELIENREPIEAKVAALISDFNIAINVGSSVKVTEGMKFSIRADSPIEIIDPDTGEILDIIDEEIIRVIVVDVKDRYSICTTYRTKFIGNSPPSPFQSQLSIAMEDFIRRIPQHIIKESLVKPFSETHKRVDVDKSVIRVGYRAIEIKE
jgi:hypothetical protein